MTTIAAVQTTPWQAYFGLRPGMTREETRAQLARMDPRSPECRAESQDTETEGY